MALPLELYDTTNLHDARAFILVKMDPWVTWIKRLGGIRLEYRDGAIAVCCPWTLFEIGRGDTVLGALRSAHDQVEKWIEKDRVQREAPLFAKGA